MKTVFQVPVAAVVMTLLAGTGAMCAFNREALMEPVPAATTPPPINLLPAPVQEVPLPKD